jgi:polygalacturonase
MLPKVTAILAFTGFFALCANAATVLSPPPDSGGIGIQQALNSLTDGGEVRLAKGTYVVHEPIILQRNHLTLRGSGADTILYLADGANCPVVVLGAPVDGAKGPVRDLHLEDLLIDGNRKNQQKEVWRILKDGAGVYNNGVDVWGSDTAVVANVICRNCRSGGMVTSAGVRHLVVRDYTAFDNQFDGLACYFTEDSDFSGLNLHDNLSAGISLDLDFNHNVIHDSKLTGNDLGIFMRQSRNNTFHGLTIEKSHHHGVFMAQSFVPGPSGWRPSPGSECAGNNFDNLSISHSGGSAFKVNDATCTNNVIMGGIFADNAMGGLNQVVKDLVAVKLPATPEGQTLALDKESKVVEKDSKTLKPVMGAILPVVHPVGNGASNVKPF